MRASRPLSVKTKTMCGRRGMKRGKITVTETAMETLNRASSTGGRRWELHMVETCPDKGPLAELKRRYHLGCLAASNGFLLLPLQGVWWSAARGWFSCSRSVLPPIFFSCHSCYLSDFPSGFKIALVAPGTAFIFLTRKRGKEQRQKCVW